MEVVDGSRIGVRATLLRQFLGGMSRLFTGIVHFRLWAYRQGLLKHHTLGCQVLSVGNLTVGGTGKTPVVEMLARSLEQSGRKVAILSRGYKKKKKKRSPRQRLRGLLRGHVDDEAPLVVSDGTSTLVEPVFSGDEPYMLAQNLPGVAVIVGKNRVRSGRHAIRKLKCDTLILDDGFQHLALKHRLDIVLVDRTNPFDNERTLPRGLLREPVRNIKRAGFIFITKSNGDGAEELRTRLRELNPTAEISECRHCPRHLTHLFSDREEDLSYLQGKKGDGGVRDRGARGVRARTGPARGDGAGTQGVRGPPPLLAAGNSRSHRPRRGAGGGRDCHHGKRRGAHSPP